jgi:hypothetical protein
MLTKGSPMSNRVLYDSPPPDPASPVSLPASRFILPGRHKTSNSSFSTAWQILAVFCLLVALPLVLPPSLAAQMRRTCPAPTDSAQFSWVLAPLYSFPSKVNGGGTLSVFSVITGADVNKQVTRRLEAGLSFTYIYDDYNFSGLGGFPRAPHPWSSVNTAGVSVPLTYSLTDDCTWKLFVQPALQFSGATGAQFGESLTFGSIVAVSHVFSPNLELGMGLGVYYNLASISVFPYPILKLKLSERLHFSNPFCAGPAGPAGGELAYSLNEHWDIGVGAAYRDYRFRLAQDGPIRNGIGEYINVPVYARVSYQNGTALKIEGYAGASVFTKVYVDDRRGNYLFYANQNPAPLIGLSLSGAF